MTHFMGESAFLVVRAQEARLRELPSQLDDSMLLRPEADVVDEIVDSFQLDVPTLHPERVARVRQGEVSGSPGTVEVVFAVPFDGMEGLFSAQPSSVDLVSYEGEVRDRDVLFKVQQTGATKESIEGALTTQLSRYEKALDQLRHDLSGFNGSLRSKVEAIVRERRQQLLTGRDLLASLEFPVRKREDAAIPVPISRRVRVGPPAQPRSEGFEPEPEVSLQDYESILGSTRSMGTVMERAPGSFSDLAEEGIRDFFLALLNFGFQGDAMGEVFTGEGRTDILIRVGDKNVFIAECKIWERVSKYSGGRSRCSRNHREGDGGAVPALVCWCDADRDPWAGRRRYHSRAPDPEIR